MNPIKISMAAGMPLLIFGSACQTAPTTSFKFVDPAHAAAPTDASKLTIEKRRTIFVDAKPVGTLVNPKFPSGPFKVPRSAVVRIVRLTIDDEGRPTVSGRSLIDLPIATPFTAACDEAISSAVAQWKFEPAQLAMLEPEKDGRPLLVSSHATDTTIEVAFTFDPSGVVKSTVNQK